MAEKCQSKENGDKNLILQLIIWSGKLQASQIFFLCSKNIRDFKYFFGIQIQKVT